MFAAVIPHLGLLISLNGSLANTAIAIIIPSMLELILFYKDIRIFTIIKDILILMLGILGMLLGSIATIAAIAKTM